MRIVSIIIMVLLGWSLGIADDCNMKNTQLEMNKCIKNEYVKYNEKMENVYKSLIENSDVNDKIKFENAQMAWIKYRDAQCEASISSYKGGSIENLIKYTCLRDITEQRIQILLLNYQSQIK